MGNHDLANKRWEGICIPISETKGREVRFFLRDDGQVHHFGAGSIENYFLTEFGG